MSRRSAALCAGLLAGLLLGPRLPAAAEGGDLAARLQASWRRVRFGLDAGLPSDRVVDVVIADDGTPWAGTARGLAWFDGFSWQAVEAGSLGQPEWMAPVDAGRLAVVCDGALFVGGREGFRPVSVPGDSTGAPVLAAVRFGGRLVALTAAGVYDVASGALIYPLSWGVSLAGPDQGGQVLLGQTRQALWLATDAGLARLDEGGWSLVLPGVEVIALSRSGGDVEAVSVIAPLGRRGLWEVLPGGKPEPVDDGMRVFRTLALAGDTTGLAMCDAGDVYLRQDGGWSESAVRGAPFDNALRVTFDAPSGLWLATGEGLWLVRLDDDLWTSLDHDAVTGGERVNVLAEDDDGDLWFGSDGGLEARRRDGGVERVRHAAGIDVTVVTAVAGDGAGRVWVGSGSGFGGALLLEAGAWRHIGAHEGLTDAPLHRIHIDRLGRPWFLSLGDGAWVRDGDRYQRAGPTATGGERVYDLAEGAAGSLWLATSGGLWRRRGPGQAWERLGRPEGLAADRVFSVAIDDSDRAWFGHGSTGPGLGCVEVDGTVRYDVDGADAVTGVVYEVRWDAAAGGLWLTASDGLWRRGAHGFHRIETSEGLPSHRLWPVLPSGRRVYVGTRGMGVSVLHLDAAGPAPRVDLRAPSIDGRRASLRWEVHAAAGLEPPAQVSTRYRTDGGAWSPWSHLREIELNDLDYGDHVLDIEALGRLGELVSRRSEVFGVPRPLYARVAVVGPVAALVALGLVALGDALRRRRRVLRELAASESGFRILLEGVSDGILIVDLEGRIQHGNRNAELMAGVDAGDRPAEALVGRALADLLEGVDADELRRLCRGLSPHAPVGRRERLRGARGSTQPVELRVTRFQAADRDWVHVSLRDNAAEIEMERQGRVRLALQRLRTLVVQMTCEDDWVELLGRLEKELHAVVEFHNCSVNLVEADDTVTQFVEWGQHVERRHLDHVPEPIRTCWREQRPVYRQTRQDMQKESFDLQAVKIQSVIDVPFGAGSFGLSHPDDDGFDAATVDLLLQFAQILTEAHRRLEDLRALTARDAEVQRARRHERLLHLATSVAHEINNPLTQIIGFADLLLRKPVADSATALATIRDAGRQAAQITHRLQAMVRRDEQGQQRLDLAPLLADAVALVRFSFAAHQVQVELRPAAGALHVVAAPGDVEHVLLSLLQACHDDLASRGGGQIVIRAEVEDGDVHVRLGGQPSAPSPVADRKGEAPRRLSTGPDLSECSAAIAAAGGRLSAGLEEGDKTFDLYLPIHLTTRPDYPPTTPSASVVQQGVSA